MKDISSRIDKDKGVIYLTEKERTAQLIKPILRGRDIKRYNYEWAGLWIIGTFPSLKLNIDEYPTLKNFLSQFLPRIEQSGEKGCRKKTSNKWFETQDNIAYYGEFAKPKIVWNPVSGEYFFTYIRELMYFNNSLFMMTLKEYTKQDNLLLYILGLMNSTLYKWLITQMTNLVEEGKYAYGAKDKIEKLPIPKLSKSQESEFVAIVQKIIDMHKILKNTNEVYPHLDTNQMECKAQSLEASSGWGILRGSEMYIIEPTSQFKPLPLIEKPLKSQDSHMNLTALNEKLNALQSQLDSMVYKLYGLDDTEIELISGGGVVYSLALLLIASIYSKLSALTQMLCENFESALKAAFYFCEGLSVPQIQNEGKIVWAEMTQSPCFIYENQGFYINQTCYFIPRDDMYLCAVLNSKLIYFYMKQIASNLGDGAFRWIKQFIEKLPIIEQNKINEQKIKEIQILAQTIIQNKKNADSYAQNLSSPLSKEKLKDLESQLDFRIYELYNLSENEIHLIESTFSNQERERERERERESRNN